jgi:hypothetical protein
MHRAELSERPTTFSKIPIPCMPYWKREISLSSKAWHGPLQHASAPSAVSAQGFSPMAMHKSVSVRPLLSAASLLAPIPPLSLQTQLLPWTVWIVC